MAVLLLSIAMSAKDPGQWIIRGVPRELMQRAKIAAAVEGRTVKDLILSLVEGHLKEMDRKGQLPKNRA